MAEPLSGADRISAYVDGEMLPQDAAAVAAEAARDPAVAQQVAQYQAMRAGVASLGADTVVIAFPDPIIPRRLPLGLVAALAASVAALAVGGMWWADAHSPGNGAALGQMATVQNADAAAMIAHFDAYFRVGSVQGGDVVVADSSDSIAVLMLANGLRQTAATNLALPSGDKAAARVFVGLNGCHLGLYARAALAGTQPAMQITDDGQTLLANWSGTGGRFTLVSRSMDPTRFATLALALHRITGAPDQDRPDLLLALAEARQPCLG